MRFQRSDDDAKDAGIDMTPIIDIVFIMLIFFVLTASFQTQQTLQVERPSTQSSDGAPKNTLVVAIDAAGLIWHDGRRIAKGEIAGIIRSEVARGEKNAVVNADRRAAAGLLVEVVDQIRLGGIPNVAVATDAQHG